MLSPVVVAVNPGIASRVGPEKLSATHPASKLNRWLADPDRRLHNMLHWDVNNGIARRNWARNEGATFAIKRAMEAEPKLKVTLPNLVEDEILEGLF